MADEYVVLDRAERIATITLNRPPYNPLSIAMVEALHGALDAIERDPAIRSVILTGAGDRAFCAGADIRQEAQFKDPAAARGFREMGRRTLNRLETFPKPIVAAIQGYCIGGGTALAWVCDLRIAADSAVFRAGDAYLGIVPSWGMGLLRLPRLIGRGRALDILLTARMVDAEEALRIGLCDRVVEPEAVLAEAEALLRSILAMGPLAVRQVIEAVDAGFSAGIDDALDGEAVRFGLLAGSDDMREGMAAFLAKRPADFRGR